MFKVVAVILAVATVVYAQQKACSAGGTAPTEAKEFLAVHNKLRASISAGTYVAKGKKMPAAKTTIPAMTWDCALEQSAQKVANTCVFAHSKDRNNVGENLYYAMRSAGVTKAGQGAAASKAWENEFQDYGWSNIKLSMAVFNSGIGHATQMAWAKSTKLGCATALCQGNKQAITVCHYKDAGNMLNANVYEPK